MHFGECGGCALQDIPYAEQVELKRKLLEQVLPADELPEAVTLEPSQEEYYYRLKMDYVVAADIFEPLQRFGLRKRGRFNHVLDLQECHLLPYPWFKRLRELYLFAGELGLENYDLKRRDGFLRYFVIRAAQEQAMLSIVTFSGENPAAISAQAERALGSGFTSVYWEVNATQSDVSSGEVVSHFGDEYIRIEVNSGSRTSHFKIGPRNFFQNNVSGFGTLIDYCRSLKFGDGGLLDLYCGVGTVGQLLLQNGQELYGVDNVPENIELARVNAELNGISSAEYLCADSAEAMSALSGKARNVVVDPPRSGLGPKAVAQLLAAAPEQLLYISCNPITQVQDLAGLLRDYKVSAQKGFDLFPQTYHMENVLLLERK